MIASKLAKSGFNIKVKKFDTLLRPYISEEQYSKDYQRHIEFLTSTGKSQSSVLYGKNLYDEVYRLSLAARLIALDDDYDIIHCHDWMTFPAGIEAKRVTGKPLVVHVHATEFDRTGGHSINPYVYDIERQGMLQADRVIAISDYVRQRLIKDYGIPNEKITVVYNAIDETPSQNFNIKKTDKIVLFLGRITLQKGPDYFIEAAKKVLDFDPDVKFIFVGSGDMEPKIIDRVAQLGIGSKVLFAGWAKLGPETDRFYQMADVYVMPSVSEPFGLTPLESLKNHTPVIISKQSGVSEVLKNALKVDFWDVDELTNKILSVINYKGLHHELSEHGFMEVQAFTCDVPARKCINIYNELIAKRNATT
jgi:glycosyltransferase involved in cell wall biosynthesis